MVAQGPDLPIHLGSMPLAVKAVIRAFPTVGAGRRLHPQRPVLRRQPPARRQRRHAGLPRGHGCSASACVRAHWPDIGSATPGSYGAAHRDLRRGPAAAAGAALRGGRRRTATWRRSSSPTCARRTSAAATCAPRSPPTCAARTRLAELAREVRRRTGCSRIMQEVMDYSERMMRAALAALPDGIAQLRGLLRRRRRPRGRRQGGRALLDPHAGDQARATRLIVDFAGHRRARWRGR